MPQELMDINDAHTLLRQAMSGEGGIVPVAALQTIQLDASESEFNPEMVLKRYAEKRSRNLHLSTVMAPGYVSVDSRPKLVSAILDSPKYAEVLESVPRRTSSYELLPGQREMVAYFVALMTSSHTSQMQMIYDVRVNGTRKPKDEVEPVPATVYRHSPVHGSFQLLNTGTGTGKSAMSLLVMVMMLCYDGIYENAYEAHARCHHGGRNHCGFSNAGGALVRVGRVETVAREIQHQMLRELIGIWPELRGCMSSKMVLEIWVHDVPDDVKAMVRDMESTDGATLVFPSVANRRVEDMIGAELSTERKRAVLWLAGIQTSKEANWPVTMWNRQCDEDTGRGSKRRCIKDLSEDPPPGVVIFIRELDEHPMQSPKNCTMPPLALHTLLTQATMSLLINRVGLHHWLTGVVSPRLVSLMGDGAHVSNSEFHGAIESLLKVNLAMPPLEIRRRVVSQMLRLMPESVRVTNLPVAWGRLASPTGEDALLTTSLRSFVGHQIPPPQHTKEIEDYLNALQNAEGAQEQVRALGDILGLLRAYAPALTYETMLRPLSACMSALQRLVERLSEPMQCPICIDAEPMTCLVMPCCTGMMCPGCLDMCTARQGKCPHCRSSLLRTSNGSLPCAPAQPPKAEVAQPGVGPLSGLRLLPPQPIVDSVKMVFRSLLEYHMHKRVILFCTKPHEMEGLVGSCGVARVVILSTLKVKGVHALRDYKDVEAHPAPIVLLASHMSGVSDMVGLDLGMTDAIVTSGKLACHAQVLGRALRPGPANAGKIVEWVQLCVQRGGA